MEHITGSLKSKARISGASGVMKIFFFLKIAETRGSSHPAS